MAAGQVLAEGVVLVTADAKNIPRDIARDVDSGQAAVESSGNRAGSKLFAGFTKFAAGAVATVGTVGVAIGGLALKGGFDRALSIQDATKKLEGLGHDTQAVSSIMESALNSVRGTAFGLGAAATTSASLVAAGVGLGGELERRLKTVADTATIAGRSMEDVGTIFGSVAAKGKLQGDDLLQLMSAGVPVLQFLAQHLGKTSEEISEMVSRGEIDFATFADAMEDGIGGAALRGGETARGAFANVMAALGRLGAGFATPIVAAVPGLFTSISTAIDGVATALRPVTERFANWLTPAIEDLSGWISGLDWTKIAEGASTFSPLVAVIEKLQEYAPLVAAWGAEIWPALSDAFKDVGDALAPVISMLADALVDAVIELAPSLIDLLTAVLPLVPALVDLAVKALPPLVDLLEVIIPPLSDFVGFLADLIEPLDDVIALLSGEITFGEFSEGIKNGGSALGDMYAWVEQLGRDFTPVFVGIMTVVGIFAGIVTAAFNLVSTAFSWLGVNVFGPIGAFIEGAFTNIGRVIAGVYSAIIQPTLTAFGAAFGAVYNFAIAPVVGWINNSIGSIGSAARNTFGGLAGVVGSAFQGALNAARGPINALISLINRAIRGINGLSVTIPDWVPAVGGQTWGLDLPSIPYLAKGGVIRTGGRVMVGEAGPEILDLPRGAQVTPLNRPDALPGAGAAAPFIAGDLIINEASDPLGTVKRLEQGARKFRRTK